MFTTSSRVETPGPLVIPIQDIKQFVKPKNTSASTVMFTVPFGRKYVGRFTCGGLNGPTINGTQIFPTEYNGATSGADRYEYTLIGGTVVTEGITASSSAFVGVDLPL